MQPHIPSTSFGFASQPELLRLSKEIVYPDEFLGEHQSVLFSDICQREGESSARRLASGDVMEDSVLLLTLVGEVENGAHYHREVPHYSGTPSVPPLSASRLDGYPWSLQSGYYNQSEGRMGPEGIENETHHQALVHGVSLRNVTPGLSPSPDPSSEDDESTGMGVDDCREESGDSGDEDDDDYDDNEMESDEDTHDTSYVPRNARGSRTASMRYTFRGVSQVIASSSDTPEGREEYGKNLTAEGHTTVNSNQRRVTRRGTESGDGEDNALLQPSLGKRKRAAADRPEEGPAPTAGHASGGSRSTPVAGRSASPPPRDRIVACQWAGCGKTVEATQRGLKTHLKKVHELDLRGKKQEMITCLWLGCCKGPGGGPVPVQYRNLPRHILTHPECKEVNDYFCDLCGISYKRACQVSRHRRQFHKVLPEEAPQN